MTKTKVTQAEAQAYVASVRGPVHVPGTAEIDDSKPDTKYEAIKAALVATQTIFDANVGHYLQQESKNLWELADVVHDEWIKHNERFVGRRLTRQDVRTMLRDSFKKANNIGWKKSTKGEEGKKLAVFTARISRIVAVACIDDKRYHEYRISGKKFMTVYWELNPNDEANSERIGRKQVVKKTEKQSKKDDDVSEGFEIEYVKSTPELKKDPNRKTSWTARIPDEHDEWMKITFSKMRDDPQAFMQFIDDWCEGLLSHEVIEGLRTDLFKQ